MKNTSNKVVNRYYQIDGLNPRGTVIATIFAKADSVAHVREVLDRSAWLYQSWTEKCHQHGVFVGEYYDNVATRFKVTPVCWRYAMACACGGFDLTKKRTRAELRNLPRDFADYLYHNSAPYVAHRTA